MPRRRTYYFYEGVRQLQTLALVCVNVFGYTLPVDRQALLLQVGVWGVCVWGGCFASPRASRTAGQQLGEQGPCGSVAGGGVPDGREVTGVEG